MMMSTESALGFWRHHLDIAPTDHSHVPMLYPQLLSCYCGWFRWEAPDA